MKGTPAFEEAVGFLTTGPIVTTAWQAPGAIAVAQATAGDADPALDQRIELHEPNGRVWVARTFGTEVIFGETVQRGIAARILEYANGLLAQAYEHAAELVLKFAQVEMSVPFLVQIDRLVQLFESPILTHVRLQLLEPEKHPDLLKALWGIVMLLPQSQLMVPQCLLGKGKQKKSMSGA